MPRETVLTLSIFFAAARLACGADPAALWSGKVQPLFDVQCVKCHGPLEQKNGLELDTPAAVLKGGDDGQVIVPGKPEESRLFQYLAADSDPHMPPKKQLSEAERGMVREWIAAMAVVPAGDGKKQAAPQEFASVTQAADHFIAAGWQSRGVTAAPEVDERTWCRRVWLDLAGRIPTRTELDEFLFSAHPSKRAALVDRLLASPDYALRMRELWDVFLMGRGKRGNNEERRKQNGWWTYLEEAFGSNRPWNETVHDILTARPDKPERRGASWFLYERRNEHQAIAEAVAPIVYGTKIDCAQCHDHPLAREIKQAHYWGLVAAFNRSKNVEGSNLVGESAVGGFINFTNLKKESQPAVVTLMTGRTIDESRPASDQKEDDSPDKYVDATAKVKVPKFSRRESFADAATSDNPLLARAFVNRMWAVLTGRGIVSPADEMNARNVPSHPELLDWLARDFSAHHCDVRRLVRGIILSRAYALGAADTPPDAFASAPERPLTAEQIARSWRVAAGLAPDDDALRRAVIAAMPGVMAKEYTASFQQAQFLTNSPALAGMLNAAPVVERMATLPDTAARVRECFLSVYARLPDSEESEHAAAILTSRPDKPADAVRDLLWALLTSAEFLTAPR